MSGWECPICERCGLPYHSKPKKVGGKKWCPKCFVSYRPYQPFSIRKLTGK